MYFPYSECFEYVEQIHNVGTMSLTCCFFRTRQAPCVFNVRRFSTSKFCCKYFEHFKYLDNFQCLNTIQYVKKVMLERCPLSILSYKSRTIASIVERIPTIGCFQYLERFQYLCVFQHLGKTNVESSSTVASICLFDKMCCVFQYAEF